MNTATAYEVSNPLSGHSFGVYQGANEREAIEACVKDAGYDSIEQMERSLEQPLELVATLAE